MFPVVKEDSTLATSWDAQPRDTDPAAAQIEFQYRVYKILNITLSSISLASSLLAFVVALIIHCVGKEVPKRVTFRMVMMIELFDALFAMSQLLSLFQDDGIACTMSTWAFVFLTLASQFLTLSIAFHLHQVVVRQRKIPQMLEDAYLPLSISIAGIISILPVLFGVIGYDTEADSCWFINEKATATFLWQLGSLYGWMFIVIAYCTLSSILVAHALYASRIGSHRSALDQGLIKRAVRRIAMYPLVPLITMSLNFVATMLLFATGEGNYYLSLAAMITIASQGWINAVIFCFDPVVLAAYWHGRNYLVYHYFPCLQPGPGTSPSTAGYPGASSPKFPLRAVTYYLLLSPQEKSFVDQQLSTWDQIIRSASMRYSLSGVNLTSNSSHMYHRSLPDSAHPPSFYPSSLEEPRGKSRSLGAWLASL